MPEFGQLAQDYIDVWNETDEHMRAELAQRVFTPNVVYVDPLVEVAGLDALLSAVAGAQRQFPDFVFRLSGCAEGHHQQMRFTWHLGPDGNEEAPIAGFDVATVSADGRIERVLGFLDRVPA